MTRLIKAFTIGLLLSFSLVFQVQAQTEGAAFFAAKGCIACHGADGNTPVTPNYPKVAGQNREYVVNQLKDFKSATRTNGLAAVMSGMVATLTDEDIEKLADFLSIREGGQ